MPSGAPAGGAELFEAGVVDQASMPMMYLRYWGVGVLVEFVMGGRLASQFAPWRNAGLPRIGGGDSLDFCFVYS